MNGYNIISEALKSNEKIVSTYRISDLKIYQNNKRILRKRITPKLTITNQQIIFSRLDTIIPVPIFILTRKTKNIKQILKQTRVHWKKRDEINIPHAYLNLDDIVYDKKSDELIIPTLKTKLSFSLKFRDTEKTFKEIIKTLELFLN